MKGLSKVSIIARAVGVVGAVAALTGGVTFAALQSQATLSNNTISSATANLQVSTDGTSFGASKPGFDFTGIVPGGADSGAQTFYLKDNGTANMTVGSNIPTAPTFTVKPSGTVDNTKVHLLINCTSTTSGTLTANDNLEDYITSNVSLSGTLKSGDTVKCTATVSMDAGAFTGTSASTNKFDIVFTGTGV